MQAASLLRAVTLVVTGAHVAAVAAFADPQGTMTPLEDQTLGRMIPLEDQTLPSVTITTITTEARRELDPFIVRNFNRQDYAGSLELLVLDQSANPSPLLTELADREPVDPRRRITYIFRNTSRESTFNTGIARNYLLTRTQGDITVVMDSDDFYFPSYVTFMVVEGLLKQSVLYVGMLGFHCTRVKKGAIEGFGFSWHGDHPIKLVGKHGIDIPNIGMGLAFFTFIRGWLRWENVQYSEEIGLSWHLSKRDSLRAWNHTSAQSYCEGKHNSSGLIKFYSTAQQEPDECCTSFWDYQWQKFAFYNQTSQYPLPMWQQRAGICPSLFTMNSTKQLWGYIIDREGHVSKSVWKGGISYTHNRKKCGGVFCPGREGEKSSGILQVLETMDGFARVRPGATMTQFIEDSRVGDIAVEDVLLSSEYCTTPSAD
jgi:hypothetical protein